MIEPLPLSSSHHLSTVYKRRLKCVCVLYIYMFVNISHGIIYRLQAFQEKIFVIG